MDGKKSHSPVWASVRLASFHIQNRLSPTLSLVPPRTRPMTTRRQTTKDDTLFWTLKLLHDNPCITQRSLAKEVGINVSSINFCLKALVEKGWVKVGNFSRNPDKLSYAYLLTPTGAVEKAALTKRFLQRKIAEYEELSEEIEAFQLEAGQQSQRLN